MFEEMREWNGNVINKTRDYYGDDDMDSDEGQSELDGKFPVGCNRCSKCFASFPAMFEHRSYAHNVLACPKHKCHSEFDSEADKLKHMRLRHKYEEKSVEKWKEKSECPYDGCDAFFYNEYALIMHVRLHQGSQLSKCYICSSVFPDPMQLLQHLEHGPHRDEKPFTCVYCGVVRQTVMAIQYHLKQEHSDAKCFNCYICSRRFNSEESLELHLLEHVGKPFTCCVCRRQFKKANVYAGHMLKCHDITVHYKFTNAETVGTISDCSTSPITYQLFHKNGEQIHESCPPAYLLN